MNMPEVFKKLFPPLLSLFSLAAAAAHIGYLYPAGGRAGATVELLAGGRDLWGISSARVSGGGVTVLGVETVASIPTTSGAQNRFLREWLRRIERGDMTPPEKPEDTRDWRKCRYWENLAAITPLQRDLVARRIFTRPDPLQSSPSIAQLVIVRLRIAPDAEPGRREFRLTGRTKITDPLPFYIDTLREVREPRFTLPGQKRPRVDFTVPAVLNGQILPGETDVFYFRARKGEKISFVVRGRALVPFLGDGVPGHFQPVLEVYDASRRLVAAADDHYYDPDPVLTFEAPHDGEFALEIRDALYRGREDFVYRIRAFRGAAQFSAAEPAAEDGRPWREAAPDIELEPPAFIRFLLDRPGASRSYRFRGRRGERLELEVLARRLNSPLDARLELRDAAGKVLAANDDAPGPRIGTVLHQADPRITVELPADGVYTVEVADASGTGGGDSRGFLRIAAPRPDFDLYVSPSAVRASGNAPAVVRVRAVRRGGFTGRIVLALAPDSPLRMTGVNTLEPEMDSGIFTLAAPGGARADGKVHPVRLSGFSGALRREARAADEAMQAFAYTHLVPAEELLAVYAWNPPESGGFRYVDPRLAPRLVPGGTAEIRLWTAKLPPEAKVSFSLLEPPAGVSVAGAHAGDGVTTLTLRAEPGAPEAVRNTAVGVEYSYKTKNGRRQKVSFVLPTFRMEVKNE